MDFRVWAPRAREVVLEFETMGAVAAAALAPLLREPDGYFSDGADRRSRNALSSRREAGTYPTVA